MVDGLRHTCFIRLQLNEGVKENTYFTFYITGLKHESNEQP